MPSTLHIALKSKASWFIAGYYGLKLIAENQIMREIILQGRYTAIIRPNLTTQELTEMALRLFPLEQEQ